MWKRYGLFCTAIMLATVFTAFMPVVSAGSSGGNFNTIAAHEGSLQKVLIGQNLEFEGFSTPVVVSRVVSGDVVNTYPAEYLPRMYADSRWVVIDDVLKLPDKITRIYKRFTT
ncbi:MAG: hypothetical protein C5S38_02830 [Candidatus Methanophagaceae archaeon]|nr:MAG: hypothetical protein C5S38_02830 [Methanophagales archaeon]